MKQTKYEEQLERSTETIRARYRAQMEKAKNPAMKMYYALMVETTEGWQKWIYSCALGASGNDILTAVALMAAARLCDAADNAAPRLGAAGMRAELIAGFTQALDNAIKHARYEQGTEIIKDMRN